MSITASTTLSTTDITAMPSTASSTTIRAICEEGQGEVRFTARHRVEGRCVGSRIRRDAGLHSACVVALKLPDFGCGLSFA